jgi:hypothetical protein
MIRTYSELIQLPTFEERFEYLRLRGNVAKETFGIERYLNQKFYRSQTWKDIRDTVILRDNGCDLADPDREITGRIVIHHMNPILIRDILTHSDDIINPEYLITTCHETHNAIHYGDISGTKQLGYEERKPFDTCPWRF